MGLHAHSGLNRKTPVQESVIYANISSVSVNMRKNHITNTSSDQVMMTNTQKYATANSGLLSYIDIVSKGYSELEIICQQLMSYKLPMQRFVCDSFVEPLYEFILDPKG